MSAALNTKGTVEPVLPQAGQLKASKLYFLSGLSTKNHAGMEVI